MHVARHRLAPLLLVVACVVTLVGVPATAQPAPSISTDRATYDPGEPITVSWSGAPGGAKDWIGLYPVTAGEPDGSPGSTLWDYLDGAGGMTAVTEGALTWNAADPGARPAGWPLVPGEYRVYLLADDGYEVLASTDLTVTSDLPEPLPEDEWPANPADPDLDGNTATLRAMTFNVWVGGDRVDFDAIVDAVEAADADVVGLQEANGNVERLADELGWDHWVSIGPWTNVVSRYPIVVPEDTAELVWLVLPDGGRVAFSNVHLRPYPYGPYDLRDGVSVPSVVANEQHHLTQMASRMETLSALAEDGVPVVLTGDFNVASHLDWTSEAAAVRRAAGEPYVEPVPWPLSIALAEAGFRDTFRTAHPDEVAVPGLTWTPGYPPGTLTDDEVHDRIDKVYVAGPVATASSEVVGEDEPVTDIVVEPWGSDHRAVVSEVVVEPWYAPPVAVEAIGGRRPVVAGGSAAVRFALLDEDGFSVPAGESDVDVTVTGAGGALLDARMVRTDGDVGLVVIDTPVAAGTITVTVSVDGEALGELPLVTERGAPGRAPRGRTGR